MPKIAVLDDDERWCCAIERFFRNDFEVVTFNDVQSFMTSPIESYDLVMIDFAISPTQRHETGINGIEIISQLRNRLKNPPKMLLTSAFISKNDPEISAKLTSIADEILPKDLGLDSILQIAKKMLEEKK